MTGEPARGPRGEGVGTEEIPGTETGKEELEGNRRVASGRAQLPKGWWLWRSVWWHLVVFSELPKLAEIKRSFTALCSSDLCTVKRHKGQMWPCVAGSLPFKLLPEHPPAKHFLQARPEKQVRLR